MDNTSVLDEFERSRNEVRSYAVLHARKGKWTKAEAVANRSGLSLVGATSALRRMKEQRVLVWEWREPEGVFRLPSKSAGSRRAELDHEARRMRLIEGPRMKPIFGSSKLSPQ
jgi:hypothetical protein